MNLVWTARAIAVASYKKSWSTKDMMWSVFRTIKEATSVLHHLRISIRNPVAVWNRISKLFAPWIPFPKWKNIIQIIHIYIYIKRDTDKYHFQFIYSFIMYYIGAVGRNSLLAKMISIYLFWILLFYLFVRLRLLMFKKFILIRILIMNDRL